MFKFYISGEIERMMEICSLSREYSRGELIKEKGSLYKKEQKDKE